MEKTFTKVKIMFTFESKGERVDEQDIQEVLFTFIVQF